MMIGPGQKMGVEKALKSFGGFVRYFDSTEPLARLAALVSAGDYRKILACCGGGDQALTMLGAGGGKGALWAVDTNPAQLFVLAAKSMHLKDKGSMPSFGQIRQAYPGRVAAVKKNISRLHQKCLCDRVTGKIMAMPPRLSEKYSIVIGNEMFVIPESGPYWQNDHAFTGRVSAGLGKLKFAKMDIFDSPDYFEPGSLDLIYISDIFFQEALPYYQAKLARMALLLRPGGLVVNYRDPGDDLMGGGMSPGRLLARQAQRLGLTVDSGPEGSGGYMVLARKREK
jgi:hypothetical protein